ncbi:MAG: beta-propeller domain-containing protein [Panacagrimonas sp.]
MNIARRSACVVAALVASLCSGCGGGGPDPSSSGTPNARLALKSFPAGCGEFVEYAAGGLTDEYLQQFACSRDALCPIFLASPGPVPTEAGSDGPDRVSGTNVQEAGVDEADIVKTDSDGRLYILSGTTLTVVEAFPPDQLADRDVVSLDLAADDPGFYASDLFLDEAQHRVVVLGSSYDGARGYATSVLIDVSDPASPQETARLGVDGYPLEVRRVGQRVHRVSRFDVPRPDWFFASEDSLQALRTAYFAARDRGDMAGAEGVKAQVRAEIGRRLDTAGSVALLPKTYRQLRGQARTETVLDCAALSRPDVSTGLGLALIDSFNVDGGTRATGGVVNNAYLVYASASNLYLAQGSSGWFLAPDQPEETVVYRLALSDTGAAAYQALGKIPGSVNGSYAFSEHEGHLRVASTESAPGADGTITTVSGLSILDARSSIEMSAVGRIANLAPGERIQGVRLLGDRGFIVTFRQIDPLFALDLSDPRHPVVASELKIPGFSSYLAPIGSDYLLTVGRDGTDEGLSGAVAVQLFDVSDLGDVQQVAALTVPVGSSGYSYSVAEHDPHAFSYFPDSESEAAPGTLTLPVSVYSEDPATAFTGFLVVRVAPGTSAPLSEVGRIDHERFLEDQDFCPPQFSPPFTAIDEPHETDDFCAPAYQLADPRRAVYMQSGADIFLYTISSIGVLASPAQQPSLTLGGRGLPYDPPCCVLIDGGVVGVGLGVAGP